MRSAPTEGTGGVDEQPIWIEGATRAFAAHAGVFDLDLRVRAGEFVALVGSSGAGKSTLLRIVNGLQPVDQGFVRTLGVDVVDASPRELRHMRSRVGFVFQHFGLVGRLTALENTLMGALSRLRLPRYGVSTYPRLLRERAVAQLERVGLADQRFQRCDTLSGGQQQRVAIARTLLQDPLVVLADEPVASLDPDTSLRVLELFSRVCREDGLTVVCSLHQTDLAQRVADRIVGLSNGRKTLDERTDTLDDDRLAALYRSSDTRTV